MLASELGTASNIKSKHVRNSVITTLKSSLQLMKSLKTHKTPENGYVLVAGETKPYI